PGDIASALREILSSQPNATVFMQDVVGIDKDKRLVSTGGGFVFDYDYLILAPGASHTYFGHDEWETHAPGLKTIADALIIREKILCAFEKAELIADKAVRKAYLRFVIIGGGPTGIELAGAIAEISRQSLRHNFRYI